ncbi:hypothetical protein MMYC01_207797 [Madurella mycetomatis]|uniref:Magnesium transport protein CorA n=1 Tax=Madurella mycetomatis TaxID=100816 RepID=A0A175VYA6_9PEZI|nr:hypothetical protein MMYC01_207797 [Madurella mycetomatis]
MNSIRNGHDIEAADLQSLKFSATPPAAAKKSRYWTGRYWTLDSSPGQWVSHRQQQLARQPVQQQGQQPAHSLQDQDGLNVTEATTHNDINWDAWLGKASGLTEDRLSVFVSSPVHLTFFDRLEDGPTALQYMALRQDRLLSIAQKLAIHRGYFSLLIEGSPCARKTKSISAIAITHFPATAAGAKITNAFISGYDEDDLAAFTSRLRSFRQFPSAASHLIMAFLEVEKDKRFKEVRTAVREMQTVIHDLANEPMGETPSARRNLNKTVDLYFVVHHLRTDGLVAWRDQLKMLRERFAASGSDEEMVEYLDQLVARYDHRIGRCDMVLQGASLAYQMETTQLTRKDTEIAIGDGKTMKAIAVLTMVFLPGTFIATMLAVPQIEEALAPERDTNFADNKWMWYIVLAIPVTVVALLAYIAWEYFYKRKYLKSLFSERGIGTDGATELTDLESGRGV